MNSPSKPERFIKFLQQDPKNINILTEGLEACIEQHNIETSLLLIEHGQLYQIDDWLYQAQAAHCLLMAGQYQRALEFALAAMQKDNSHPILIYDTACAYFYCHQYQFAANLLENLIKEHSHVTFFILYARCLHYLEQFALAQQVAEQALTLKTDNIEAMGLLSALYYENDQDHSALELAQKTLSINNTQLDALLTYAAIVLDQLDIENANKLYLFIVQQYPQCGRAWSALGEIAFSQLDFTLAESYLQQAVKYLSHIGTWHLLAWIYILHKDLTKAREALTHSYAIDRNFAETHGALAVVDVLADKFDEASLSIRRALKLDPQCMSAKYAQALLLEKEDNVDEAKAILQEVLSRNNNQGITGHQLIAQKLQELEQLKKRR